MERRINMSDFTAFSDEINEGMAYLEHHQILGAKWGKRNGPPYPLGSGDHSSAEKSAAKAAGVKVGQDSGKGSIANVKKKSTRSKSAKKVMTEEEKRAAAVEAVKSGDRKKIAKYASYLTSQELQDAENRVRNLSNITREEPGQQKASKAEMAKMEAIRSGDKEKVREFADQMSYNELSEAMNRIDLNAKLNYEKPPKTALDKLSETMNKVDTFRIAAEKGIAAYNVAAAVYNSTHRDGAQWPIIEKKVNKPENKKEQDVIDKLQQQVYNDVKKGVQQTKQNKVYNEVKVVPPASGKMEAKKGKEEYDFTDKPGDDARIKELNKMGRESQELGKKFQEEMNKSSKYTPEQAPKVKSSFFGKKDKETTQEPTEEQKRMIEENRKQDERYLKQINEMSKQKMSDYDDFDYSSIFSESYKQTQRDTSFQKAMEEFDYEDWKDSVRWSDF